MSSVWAEAVARDGYTDKLLDAQRVIVSLLRSTPQEVEQKFRDVAEAGPDYFVDTEEIVLYP